MRKIFILLLLTTSCFYSDAQLLIRSSGTLAKPPPEPEPEPQFLLWASFKDDDASPIDSYTADTGQPFDIVQTTDNLFIQQNELRKAGSGTYGTNTLTSQNSIAREDGYCFAYKFRYTTGGVIAGFLTSGSNAHRMQVSSGKMFCGDQFSLSDINFVLDAETNYTGFIVVRPSGCYWILNSGNNYYLNYVSTKHSFSTLQHVLNLSSVSSVDWVRCKMLTGDYLNNGLSTFTTTDATDGLTFTHSSSGWMVFKLQTQGATEIRFRVQDSNNYLKLTTNASNIGQLYEVVAGVESQMGSNFSITASDEYRIFVNGSDIRVFGNASTALLLQVTNTNFINSTDGVIQAQGSGNITNFDVYPFSLTDLDQTSQLQEIQEISEPVSVVTIRTIYASPDAVSGDGSSNNPYSWSQAIGDATYGTTIRLKEGTYTNINGNLNFFGAEGYPVYVKPEVGAHVILDAADNFFINGADVVFDGSDGKMEIMTDAWTGDRFLTTQHYDAAVNGARSKLINCLVHDFGNLGFWWTSINGEIYGNLVWNIGRGNGSQGHPIYTQNNLGLKQIRNNIFMQTFNSAFTMHLYGSGASSLKNYIIDKNITHGGRFLCGAAGTPVENVEITNGIHSGAGQMEIGLLGGVDQPHNHFKVNWYHFWQSPIQVKRGVDFEILNNVFEETVNTPALVINNTDDTVNIEGNTYNYWGTIPNEKWQFEGVNYTTIAGWRSGTGFDLTGSYTNYNPGISPDYNIIIPNDYDTQRASVAIKNVTGSATVSLDLSSLSGLINGTNYSLLNAQNPTESFDFTYTGVPIIVPMTGWTVSQPIGTNPSTMPLRTSTFPSYGFFYLIKDL